MAIMKAEYEANRMCEEDGETTNKHKRVVEA
jgi:hypothetical protein